MAGHARKPSTRRRSSRRRSEPERGCRLRSRRTFDDGEPYTFRHLASDYYRKRRKGLRASSLTDMLNKLQAHLLPFFGEYLLDQIDEQLVEDYIERKQRENDRIRAAESIGRPYRDKRGRPLRPLKPSTINTHLHLLAGILDRAVREGLIPRNPARGEDLRLGSGASGGTASSSTRLGR